MAVSVVVCCCLVEALIPCFSGVVYTVQGYDFFESAKLWPPQMTLES